MLHIKASMFWQKCIMWQRSSSANGIKLDMNQFNGDMDMWNNLCVNKPEKTSDEKEDNGCFCGCSCCNWQLCHKLMKKKEVYYMINIFIYVLAYVTIFYAVLHILLEKIRSRVISKLITACLDIIMILVLCAIGFLTAKSSGLFF